MKMQELRVIVFVFITFIVVTAVTSPEAAGYATPQIGGGTVGMATAPMIMLNATIIDTPDGKKVAVRDDAGNDWVTLTGDSRPVMRPLVGADGQPLTGLDGLNPSNIPLFNALNGKAWNWQYGWAIAKDPLIIPADLKIWFEVTDQSDGMNTYGRTDNYAQIFETTGSKWTWTATATMYHNAYTVTPGIGNWSATYKVYVGDPVTGAEAAGYQSTNVTLEWASVPEPATLGLMGIGAGIVSLFRQKRSYLAA